MAEEKILGRAEEIEAKFVCPEGLNREEIDRALAEKRITIFWHEPKEQIDIYYDNQDGQLLKKEMSLRRRKIGNRSIGTLKFPRAKGSSVMERQEIEWEISEVISLQGGPTISMAWMPQEVRNPLKSLAIHSIKPVLNVINIRQKADIMDPDGLKIELTIDDIQFKGPRGKARRRELELELKEGDYKKFKENAESLRSQFSLEPSFRSKFSVGMELVG